MALRFKWVSAESAKMRTTLKALATGFPLFPKFTKPTKVWKIFYTSVGFAKITNKWKTIR